VNESILVNGTKGKQAVAASSDTQDGTGEPPGLPSELTEPKAGRKRSGTTNSLNDQKLRAKAELKRIRDEVRELERRQATRVAGIVGSALLASAERDPTFKAYMVEQLRVAPMSAANRAEIAFLLIDDQVTP